MKNKKLNVCSTELLSWSVGAGKTDWNRRQISIIIYAVTVQW